MRITGGCWRSRPLVGPSPGMPLRPTPDALRERAFAVLGDRVAGASFLDLYAGTGAVGLEALSRGAAAVVFVEAHRAAARIISANLERFELGPPVARLVVRPAATALDQLSRRRELFDLLWADPPFVAWEEGLDVVAAACRRGLVATAGRSCLECPAQANPELVPGELVLERDLKGGASRLWILARTAG